MSKKTKLILLVVPVPLILILLAIYLSLIYIPGWYQPEHIGAQNEQQLLDEFTEVSRTFNNGMQRPKPFVLTLTERQINRFIAGYRAIAPQLKQFIPPQIREPAIAWQDDWLKIGAIVSFKGKDVLAAVAVRVTIDDELIHIKDVKVKLGAWPVPMKTIAKNLRQELIRNASTGKDKNKYTYTYKGLTLDEILKKRTIPNRFSYLNSDFDVRIKKIEARDGKIELTFEPIDP